MSKGEKSVGMENLFELFSDFLSAEDITASKLMTQVATAVTAQRLALGMNQSQFANHIGVKQSQISRWECGNNNFTLRKLAEIACALDLDVDIRLKPAQDAMTSKKPSVLQTAEFLVVRSESKSSWSICYSGRKEGSAHVTVC